MTSVFFNVSVFIVPLVVLWFFYGMVQRSTNRKALKKMQDAKESGLTEPASLHPAIDPSICLGCGTCVTACPEGEILGLINRKAVLVSPSSCIGHGACQEACPTGAITLVFGTETRGIEIPMLSPQFETTVPGIFIAGELGGMGLIKNAIIQGTQAVNAIKKRTKKTPGGYLDLLIVGAGPAGISAALAAKQNGLNFIVVEQDTVGGTVAHYPRGKIVMTQPAVLPLVGKFQFREASKETLMEFWESAANKIKEKLKTEHRVESVEAIEDGFQVTTNKQSFRTGSVLLAMGRRGTPRKLEVPGEDLPKVIYRLIDPEQYANRRVLVVGGGDSALEAALAIAEQPGTVTTLSYRSPAFTRAKPKNRERVTALGELGKLQVLLNSNVQSIAESQVLIKTEDGVSELPNDDVLVCAGGVLATPFLKKAGINVEEKFGAA